MMTALPMNVLLVEDEVYLADHLTRVLRAEGHNTLIVQSEDQLKSFLESVQGFCPDLVILDRLLLGRDLVEYVPQIRSFFSGVRILVLSAIGGAKDRASCLELGADDYVNKPFDVIELLARIKVLFRRSDYAPRVVQKSSVIRINVELNDVEILGQRLFLPRKEYLLAKTLIESPNRVFNRFFLMDAIWDIHSEVESNVLEVAVSRLRKKFSDFGADIKIHSRRNVGYWIEI